jgi:hypothetical protein
MLSAPCLSEFLPLVHVALLGCFVLHCLCLCYLPSHLIFKRLFFYQDHQYQLVYLPGSHQKHLFYRQSVFNVCTSTIQSEPLCTLMTYAYLWVCPPHPLLAHSVCLLSIFNTLNLFTAACQSQTMSGVCGGLSHL